MSKRSQDEGPLNPQLVALAALAHGSLGRMSPAQQARGLERMTERLQRGHGRGSLRLVLLGGALATAALALVVLPRAGDLGHPGTGAAPLAYAVEGGVIGPSGAISSLGQPGSTAAASPTVRFADGTQVRLIEGARGRLTSVDHQGARFAIERGAADVRVTPRPGARWLFDAGPFLITVHGTAFVAAWDETEGKLDLRLEKGLVSVSGPVAGGPISVKGGQHLTVTLRQARVLLRALAEVGEVGEGGATAEPAGAVAAAPATAPPDERPPAPHAPAAIRPTGAGAARPGRTGGGWVSALAAGDFASIVRDADRDGERALAVRSSDELAALADAARYSRRAQLARDALLAQRRRFPRSVRATDAAFFLGRLEEGTSGGLDRSVKWYDRYLEEAPSGTYASEALGRKMVAVQKLHGTAPARATAEEYARRFPSGTYAGAARALLDSR